MSAILRFLEGHGRDARGRSISDVHKFDRVMLERHHDFIQWLFPLPEPSNAVPGSPILTASDIAAIAASDLAQANLSISTELMLTFYRRSTHWLAASDHNHLRITRIIKSLRLLAGAEAANSFRNEIFEMASTDSATVSATSLGYWRAA